MTQLYDQDTDFELNSVLGEFYFADGEIAEDDGLVWKEILREGEWKMRPGPGQKPIPVPLKIVSGHADTKDTIGMADLLEAFDDGAIDHVTVPTSHEDKPHENTGYVKKLKIVDHNDRKVMMAGIDFTEPEIKEKALRGSILNTSAGIIFDYIKKESGKMFRQALGHVALTNKPWLNGMKPFGGLADEAQNGIMAFSEDTEEEVTLDDETFIDFLDLDAKLVPNKPGVKNWVEKLGGLPKKIADMAGDLITERGFSVSHAIATAVNRAKELCAKGDAEWCNAVKQWEQMKARANASENEIEAHFSVQDLKRAIDDGAPKEKHEILATRARDLGRLDLVPDEWDIDLDEASADEDDQQLNASANTGADKTQEGGKMGEGKVEDSTTGDAPSAGKSGESAPVELSEDARKALFAEWEEAQAEKQREKDAENENLRSQVHEMKVNERIGELKEQGFSEYPGLLAEIRNIMLADKGTETLTLSEEVDGEVKESKVTVTGALERVLNSLPKTDGKVDLGDQLNASENHGKPASKEGDAVELSEEELEQSIEAAEKELGREGLVKKDGDS